MFRQSNIRCSCGGVKLTKFLLGQVETRLPLRGKCIGLHLNNAMQFTRLHLSASSEYSNCWWSLLWLWSRASSFLFVWKQATAIIELLLALFTGIPTKLCGGAKSTLEVCGEGSCLGIFPFSSKPKFVPRHCSPTGMSQWLRRLQLRAPLVTAA